MTDYIIRIIVDGKDNASGPLNSVGSALGNMSQIAGGILGADLIKRIGEGIFDLGKYSIGVASRTEEMNVVLEQLGKNAGLSKTQLDGAVQSVKDMGITTGVAQNTVAAFVRSNLDLSKS